MTNFFAAIRPRRKQGISLLIPSQNTIETLEFCVRSFHDFADEIIIVDNGSNDGSIKLGEQLSEEMQKVSFYSRPEIKDLYENRQFALQKSSYHWIVRIDSDYMAFTSGLNNITNLREFILSQPHTLRPKAFGITQINVFENFNTYGLPKAWRKNDTSNFIPPPENTLPYRIIEWFPGLRFKRKGRWEVARWEDSRLYKYRTLHTPYWLHCTFKRKEDLLIRSERNNWRELGNFEKYPTRDVFIKEAIQEKYGTTSIQEAAEQFWTLNIAPNLITRTHNESSMPLPEIAKQHPRYNS